ncbi:MAG TPA: AMP-binding protein [Kofleriaceae bacterium]|nr:AMP-binding protein [Kofleriaceae bacterium]
MEQASIAARFLEHARRAARAPALRWRDETISYGDLLKRAQDAAARLAGAPPGTVGVLATKSPEAVALILGCLLTGRAFLVASPSLPEATLAELVERAGCVRVFTDPPGGPAAGSPVEIALGGPRDIGFMLTTSGSTGVPKIVPLPNGGVAEFARWADTTFGLGPGRRVLNYAPLNFDLCLLDIWATLAAGGCCVLVDPAQATSGPALAHQITEATPHVVQAVPLLFELLMDAGLVAPSVRHVIVTGYAIRAECLAALPRMFPGARLHNLYGCTETNDSFLAPLRPGAPLVLGDPLPGVTALLVGADGREVIGAGTGELWVATAFQTPGYLGGALAEKFVERDGVRLFRSGDLVQRHGDGSLTLLGRTDFQVKVAGQRVNLQEIEQCLLAHPSVLDAAVVAIADERYGHRLHAALCRRPGAVLDSLGLRRHCVAHLPRAAMPQTIAIGDQALPKTSTGKVDRNRIKELAWTAGTPSSSTSSRSSHQTSGPPTSTPTTT